MCDGQSLPVFIHLLLIGIASLIAIVGFAEHHVTALAMAKVDECPFLAADVANLKQELIKLAADFWIPSGQEDG